MLGREMFFAADRFTSNMEFVVEGPKRLLAHNVLPAWRFSRTTITSHSGHKGLL
jgi:capsule polysaccharide export protein KpsE/RkpR